MHLGEYLVPLLQSLAKIQSEKTAKLVCLHLSDNGLSPEIYKYVFNKLGIS
jgi:hypothetical protein